MWISKQKQEVLEAWIKNTKTPMLATLPDGEILFVNKAFTELLGYTSVELVGEKTWIELTKNDENLVYDQMMVNKLLLGQETGYQLQKKYISKTGTPIEVVIDVIRYPQSGDFEVFLVVVTPVNIGIEFALGQLTEIRQLMLALAEREPSGITFEKITEVMKGHPVISTIVLSVLSTLLFGNRIIEIIQAFNFKI